MAMGDSEVAFGGRWVRRTTGPDERGGKKGWSEIVHTSEAYRGGKLLLGSETRGGSRGEDMVSGGGWGKDD